MKENKHSSWMDRHNIFKNKKYNREMDRQIKRNGTCPKYTISSELKEETDNGKM